jgi:2-polyprenyl-3-methyl-5-hydroxy-6-metoxy-1,4-benzoquinol methylase
MQTEPAEFQFDERNLDFFIQEADRLGAAGRKALLRGQLYKPTASIDAQLQPRSTAYKQQQFALYRELTGHDYLDHRDEHSKNVPVEHLITAASAYGHMAPGEISKHYIAMSMLVQEMRLPKGARILELGSGWGFTQEFLATCGYETVGIEMNQDFVAASNGRLKRLGFGERVRQGTFESFDVTEAGSFDAIVTYEAFHHAVETEGMLRKYISCLKPGGLFALAAEPFNDFYRTWGLRLDAESIYAIRKFGWFESGWSVEYMADLLNRCGMDARFINKNINEMTRYMVGTLSDRRRPYQLGMWDPAIAAGWWASWDYCSSKGSSALLLAPPPAASILKIDAVNFNKTPLKVSFVLPRIAERHLSLPTGPTEISIPLGSAVGIGEELRLEVTSETYCPAKLGLNADARDLGVHIKSIRWA